jgi:hypothetical protein
MIGRGHPGDIPTAEERLHALVDAVCAHGDEVVPLCPSGEDFLIVKL